MLLNNILPQLNYGSGEAYTGLTLGWPRAQLYVGYDYRSPILWWRFVIMNGSALFIWLGPVYIQVHPPIPTVDSWRSKRRWGNYLAALHKLEDERMFCPAAPNRSILQSEIDGLMAKYLGILPDRTGDYDND